MRIPFRHARGAHRLRGAAPLAVLVGGDGWTRPLKAAAVIPLAAIPMG
jgi:hypothetical protein